VNRFERLIGWLSPKWAETRARSRLMARHYEAASSGRRTSGWHRLSSDANAAASGPTLAHLRGQARDLVRNNPWARKGLRTIVRNTVGYGIRPKANGRNAELIANLWKVWAETTQCDAAGRLNFYGLQRLVMRTVVESGEVLIRRRWRLPKDGLAVPMQLQVIEPDLIDTGKDSTRGEAGGRITQGIEFDMLGRRVAYWLFDQHPGGRTGLLSPVSRRVPADNILHVYEQERAGQLRGPSWFASVDVRLHDFDEFEDATLMKQKIASCMAAFVTDLDGTGAALGTAGTDAATGQPTDELAPGMILNLPVGKQVTFATPPPATDHQSFSATVLRAVAAGLGVTYEDLTGDYSQVNYSSARMARLAHWADVHDWRWNMLIPQFCAPAWSWMVEALLLAGVDVDEAPADWTPPPAAMIDPDKEGAAVTKNVRAGVMTHDEMVREQGHDPDTFWKEYAAGLKRLDDLGIVLDSDARKTTGSGQAQAQEPAAKAPANGASKPNGVAKPAAGASDGRQYDA
jgi:lambda family phage portal protein